MYADYVEETTTSIAGTSGNGAVTLTQISGLPRFSTVFGSSARLVKYSIEDTVNLKFEQGVGSVASNVLTRSTPRVTWDGTTYDSTNPSAIQFGATPTSGDVRVRMAPLSDSGALVVPYFNTSATGNRGLGLHSADVVGSQITASVTLSADTEYWIPFLWVGMGEVTGFQIEVTTGVGSTNIKACLSEVNSSGLPGTKLVDFTGTPFDTSTTGTKTSNPGSSNWTPDATFKLPPGWYYVGLIANGGSVIAGTAYYNGLLFGSNSSYILASPRLQKSGSYATGLASSPASLSVNGSSTRPCVWMTMRN